jgi:hypothetical protein
MRPRLTFQTERDERTYDESAAAEPFRQRIPPGEAEIRLSLIPSAGSYRYVRTRLLDNFGNVEDRTFGAWGSVTATRSLDLRRDDRVFSSGGVSLGCAWEWPRNVFASGALGVSGKHQRRLVNVLYQPRLTLFLRAPERMVTAIRVQALLAGHADRFWNTRVGGDAGLRGVETYALTGQNTTVLNLEERWYSPLNVLTVNFGAVAFADFARIWTRPVRYREAPWHGDAGFGLRLGFARLPGFEVMRMDFAWPLEDRPFLFSFGTGMYFTL